MRLKNGPYGPYLQLAAAEDGSEKARNVALPASAATASISLQVRTKTGGLKPGHDGESEML